MAKRMTDQPLSTLIPDFFYGTAWKEERTKRLVEQAIAAGFRAIDTANQRKHYFEEAVGEGISSAIASRQVNREHLFLQTKFTFQRGQDHRLPYDPKANIADQVVQSFESSLNHLNADYLDSLVLHGPSSSDGLKAADWSAWRSMESLHASGRVRFLGISNVNLAQLKALWEQAKVIPRFVQNRCYASKAWDKEVRTFCRENQITYQGFSLLTANRQILRHPKILEIGKRHRMSISQTIFRFAMDAGMIPLTGTTNPDHMAHDLLSSNFKLSANEVTAIERIAIDINP